MTRSQMFDVVRRCVGDQKAVVLTGPAGIGKSYLMHRALHGSDVLVVQCLAAFERQALRPLAYAVGAPLYGDVDDVATAIVGVLADRCLAVEDLHWADERTVEVLARLVGRVPIVATSRTSGRLDDAVELEVPPLSPSEANDLVDRAHDSLTADRRAALLDAAAGSPLLLLNLFRADVLSPTFEAAVRERLQRAAPATIDALARLALHGRPAPRHWVSLIASPDAEGMVASVERDRVWFSHEKFAEGILALLTVDHIAARRWELVELSDDADAARHLFELGEYGRAAELAQASAEHADLSTRADLLALAVAALGSSAPVRLRLAACDAMLVSHRTAEARSILEPIEGDGGLLAEVELRRSQVSWLEGRADEALAQIEAALAAASGTGDEIEIRVLVERAHVLVRTRVGEPDIVTVAEHALARARETGVALSQALNACGLARSHTGQPGWRALFDEALAIAEAAGDEEQVLAANYWTVSSLGFYGPMTEAASIGDEMVERTSRTLSRRWHHHFLSANAVHRFGLARLDSGRFEEAKRLLEHEPLFRNRSQLDLVIVASLCDLDRVGEARAALEEGRRYVRNREDAALVAIAASEVALQARDHDAMCESIAELASVGTGFFGLNVLLESAAIHLSAVHPLDGVPHYSARLTPTLGTVALEREAYERQMAADLDGAAATMQRAAEAWEKISMLRFAWRAHISAARLAIAAGALDEAACSVTAASDLLPRMVARPAPARADEVSRELDRARARESLTPREVEVLVLVGAGLSTAEIAARLDISAATVESHVTNAMRRLGCSTRRQAAGLVL